VFPLVAELRPAVALSVAPSSAAPPPAVAFAAAVPLFRLVAAVRITRPFDQLS
jgi:hypothetical protein